MTSSDNSGLPDDTDADGLAEAVSRLGCAIGDRDLHISLAESCTGGLMSSAIVADPQVGGALDRGFVVYSVEAKCELLGLNREEVEACGGVSENVARQMAKAALVRSKAGFALAITGFAGPRTGDEEVGLVHVAVAITDRDTRHLVRHFGEIGRERVRMQAAIFGLGLLIDAIRQRGEQTPDA